MAVIDRASVRRAGASAWGGVPEWIGRTAWAQIGDEAGGCAARVSTGAIVVAGLDVPFGLCLDWVGNQYFVL